MRPPEASALNAELRRLHWALNALLTSSSALFRAASPIDVMASACEAIVAGEVYPWAFVAVPDPTVAGGLRRLASAGAEPLDREALGAEAGAAAVAFLAEGADTARCVDRDGEGAFLFAPLTIDARVIGLLGVASPDRSAFDGDARRIFTLLADELALALDLDARRRRAAEVEASLIATESRYRQVFDHAPDGIVVSETSEVFGDANPAACRMLGYARDELLTLRPIDIVAPSEADSVLAVVSALRRGLDQAHDRLFRRKDGSLFPGEVLATGLPDGGFIAIIRDVSARREAEWTLRSLQKRLAAALRLSSMGELAAALAHEVNQPLTGQVTNAQAALNWLSREPTNLGEVRLALERIVRDALRAGKVIERTRALFTKAEPETVVFDLIAAVRETLDLSTLRLSAAGAVVETRGFDGVLPVRADRTQIQQVLVNLIGNAYDSLRDAAIEDPMLRVTLARDVEFCVVSVEDNGAGLPDAEFQALFEPFVTHKADGVGLGLSISRAIVEAHGGRIWAERGVERGAIFRFSLPIAPQQVGQSSGE